MLFAWQVGSRHDLALGILSVAMAAGLELSKPFAISSAFASLRQLRVITAASLALVGILAVCYSLQAELTFMSMTRGDLVAERSSARDAGQRADSRYQKVEADLAALKPVSNKERDMNAYLERRDQLQNELRAAERDRQSAPAVLVSDPGATALAAYAASLGAKIDPQTLGLWLPLVGVLALEIGAAFSVVLVRSVATVGPATPPAAVEVPAVQLAVQAQPVPVVQTVVQPVLQPAVQKPAKRKRKGRRPPSGPGASGPHKRGLAATLRVLQGGAARGSQRALAQAIGTSKSTVQRALALLDAPRFAAA
jgi:hypothetical protein